MKNSRYRNSYYNKCDYKFKDLIKQSKQHYPSMFRDEEFLSSHDEYRELRNHINKTIRFYDGMRRESKGYTKSRAILNQIKNYYNNHSLNNAYFVLTEKAENNFESWDWIF